MPEPTPEQLFRNACQHYQAGRLPQAETCFRQILAAFPHCFEAYSNLGEVLRAQGRPRAAIIALDAAIAINPNYAEAHNNRGYALYELREVDSAITACRRAISLRPDYPEAQNNLGNALLKKGEVDPAIGAFREAIRLRPTWPKPHSNLANALSQKGEVEEAISSYRQAISLDSNYLSAHSNLVYTLHYHPAYDSNAIAEEHRRWNRQYAEPLKQQIRPHTNDRSPDRRLRLGYVSPDLRMHAVGRFMLPLLGNHDKKEFEVFGYAQGHLADEMTERLRSHTDNWREISELSDAGVADLIREDKIDILVDLAMHSANNRLLVFAHKPSPVQVTYLAYCSSSGLEAIDYRLSDPYLDPSDVDAAVYSEKTIHLPETYWCYRPIMGSPEVGPLPVLNSGFVTFGSLNNFNKVNESTLTAWANILRSVPNSRLLLHAHDGSHRQRVRDHLYRDGIDPTRVQFVGKVPLLEYFQLYHTIDIALDTFPYGGGTTTCDALWMGVPVVSLMGKTAVGRGGFSILSNVGVPELVANSANEYAQIATNLANAFPRLSDLRATLRQRMVQSPLMDEPRFARHIEEAYRQMWHEWCAMSH